MNFEWISLSAQKTAQWRVDALIVLVPKRLPAAEEGGADVHAWVAQAQKAGDLEAGVGKVLDAYRPAGFAATRVVMVSVGEGAAADVRKATAAAMAALKHPKLRKVGVFLGWLPDQAQAVRAAMVAAAEASYCFTTTKPTATARSVSKLLLAVSEEKGVKAAFAHAEAAVVGVEMAKEWANRPANHATPVKLADAAKQVARQPGFKVWTLGPKEVADLGMGAFLAVAQGSAEPLRFIVMQYNGGEKGQAPVVLVGKGITFDTGGISIKPAAEMDEMKFDMGGAASVLGTFAALGRLRPKLNVIGLIPACENMPDGQAVKPGDVVTSMSGQTIEILNTDAEGRLILCDALTYAARFKPHSVIDIATLTGACVIALGAVRSGLFSARDELARALHDAGERALDPCWRMPLDDAYAEGLKSNFADMGNVAGRAAGAITAAKFLQKFATDLPWAHLDIAGTAWKSGASKGATGRPVPLLLQYLCDVADASPTPAAPKRASAEVKRGQVPAGRTKPRP